MTQLENSNLSKEIPVFNRLVSS